METKFCTPGETSTNRIGVNDARLIETATFRYSAVTSTPDDFIAENFTLRQTHYERETELMIVITMYNEDEILFLRTLHGVMRNIGHLEGRKNSGTWGPGSWKKVRWRESGG